MSRRLRVSTGGVCYHVPDRAVGRGTLFGDDAGYLAFERVIARVHERSPVRMPRYCLRSDHWLLVLLAAAAVTVGVELVGLGVVDGIASKRNRRRAELHPRSRRVNRAIASLRAGVGHAIARCRKRGPSEALCTGVSVETGSTSRSARSPATSGGRRGSLHERPGKRFVPAGRKGRPGQQNTSTATRKLDEKPA